MVLTTSEYHALVFICKSHVSCLVSRVISACRNIVKELELIQFQKTGTCFVAVIEL